MNKNAMMTTETVKISQLVENKDNPRYITKPAFEKLVKSILIFPRMLKIRPIVVDGNYKVLGGNMRLKALERIKEMQEAEIRASLESLETYTHKTELERANLLQYWKEWQANPVASIICVGKMTEEEQREFIIKDNVGFGEWNFDVLANEWDDVQLEEWGMNLPQPDDAEEDKKEANQEDNQNSASGISLFDRFIVPPFSILDTRKGYWQDRKKKWYELMGDLGDSRKDTLFSSLEMKFKDLYQRTSKHRKELGLSFKEYIDKYVSQEDLEKEQAKIVAQGVSIFDPVVSEIMCRWFTPKSGSKIFDCFAGDTAKGLVFVECGHSFIGIELRPEQVEINNKIIEDRGKDIRYICDDGQNVAKHIEPESQDLLFSCPPYFDLEVYSDLPNDASNQGTYEDFIQVLENGFSGAVGCLKNNRFAVIVVGDIRDKKTGFYYDFCGDIKRIFKQNGMRLYNEIILVEQTASTALRASRYMDARKVAKTHQHILVFFKGDPKKIKGEFERIEYTEEDMSKFTDVEPNNETE